MVSKSMHIGGSITYVTSIQIYRKYVASIFYELCVFYEMRKIEEVDLGR